MSEKKEITILGGGLAGLAAGYYAKKEGLPFKIYEATGRIGGNSTTLRHGDFLFDSGAHRFHDEYKEITREIKDIVGDGFKKINVPSQVYYKGRLLDFPFIPFNLMKNLGAGTFAKATLDFLRSRFRFRKEYKSFEDLALCLYGKTIAGLFLLNYSEKLWGMPCDKLSFRIAGKRLKGLNLRSFIKEAVFGRNARIEHFEGLFYYPKKGIGIIAESLEELCGEKNIVRDSRITRVLHDSRRIKALEINGDKTISVDEVISTLPLNGFLQIMEPAPPEDILDLTKGLHYRSMVLAVLFIDKETINGAATVYFPDRSFPFTRVYEPKNRSEYMSPEGKTSLVIEIPCQRHDRVWEMEEKELARLVSSYLIKIGWIKEEEISGSLIRKLDYAYPVLEIGYKEKISEINAFLKRFDNLRISGRNGRFVYSWIHDMMKFGKEVVIARERSS